jgi:uncharacterized protein
MAEKQEWYADGLRFTCTQCGHCCTGPSGYVWFSDAEAAAMAAFLKMAVPQFLAKFAHQVNGRWSLNETLTEHGYDCAMLRRDSDGKAICSIYSARPMQCRTWPFWPENLRSNDDWLRAAQRCPGMAEGLKGQGALYPVEHIRVIRDSNPRK